jgi:hypothetical protein
MPEIKISPLAYIDIVRHAFISPDIQDLKSPAALIYGLLAGSVENGKAIIKSYIPLFHIPQSISFETNHKVFQYADQYNAEHYDPEYQSNGILGYLRSGPAEETFQPVDKSNLLYFQTGYSDNAVAIYIPPDGDQYSIQIKRLKGPLPELDLDSELEDVDWNFDEFDDIDELFKLVLNLNSKRRNHELIINEIEKTLQGESV